MELLPHAQSRPSDRGDISVGPWNASTSGASDMMFRNEVDYSDVSVGPYNASTSGPAAQWCSTPTTPNAAEQTLAKSGANDGTVTLAIAAEPYNNASAPEEPSRYSDDTLPISHKLPNGDTIWLMPDAKLIILPDGGYMVQEPGCATVVRHPGDDGPSGFWEGFGAGLNAGASSLAYAFSRPIDWITGDDGGATAYYNRAWEASGIQGTWTQTITDWAAGTAAAAAYSALALDVWATFVPIAATTTAVTTTTATTSGATTIVVGNATAEILVDGSYAAATVSITEGGIPVTFVRAVLAHLQSAGVQTLVVETSIVVNPLLEKSLMSGTYGGGQVVTWVQGPLGLYWIIYNL